MVKADQLAAEQAADYAMKQQRAARLDELVRTFESKIGALVGMLSSN
jgi:methyl-accepting chemotaxis protein